MTRHHRILVLASFIVATIVIFYIVLARPWHMRWGATDDEVAMPLPGDAMMAKDAPRSTRAVTIRAPAAVVWSWLVQLGQGRGGWYSHEWLENLFAADMHNIDEIVPALQKLEVGDPLLYTQQGFHATVATIERERLLLLEGGWTFRLDPVEPNSTRLIVRWSGNGTSVLYNALYYYPILEPAHFVMEVGMMLGIKQRAERSVAPGSAP